MSCIFCSILAGRVPASVVFQDERIVAFMDIRPVRPGQTLVIPRQHVDHFSDLPEDLASHIFLFGHRLAGAMRGTLSPERVGMIIHGFGVRHAHLVVLPMNHPTDITSAPYAYLEEGEVKFAPDAVEEAPREELDDMAQRLRAGLEG